MLDSVRSIGWKLVLFSCLCAATVDAADRPVAPLKGVSTQQANAAGPAVSAGSPIGEGPGHPAALRSPEHLPDAAPPESASIVTQKRDHPGKRAGWNALFRRDSQGLVLGENRLRALQQACEIPIDPSMTASPGGGSVRSATGPSVSAMLTFPGTAWQSLGPQPIQSRTTSKRAFGDVAGRVDALAVHPANPSILLLGAATGGIWKSIDAGATWRPVSDTAPTLATSSIAFAPSNPSILFAATGETDEAQMESVSGSFGTYLGAGLLKSVDGGDTWIRVDSTQPGNLPSNSVLSRVVVNSSDPQKVLVGVDVYLDVVAKKKFVGGLHRSTDGGVHFTRTFSHAISDLVQDPSDPSRVYLATGRCSGCLAGGVYVSTDFGQTWSASLTASSPAATFATSTGNIKLGVTRAGNTTVLYASVLDTADEHTRGGIYRSVDGGTTWSKTSVDATMCPAPPGGNQCDYDHWITPASGSSSTVYFGSIDLYKSSDGAATWSKLTDVYGPSPGVTTIHPDQHAGVAVAGSPSTLYFANDGGLYRTQDGGQTFQNLNSTLSLAQFNVVALHPTNPNFAMGGTQDNASIRYTGSPVWTDRTLGDGGFNAIRADSPGQIFSVHYFAYFESSTDGGTTFTDATPCKVLMDCDNDEPSESMAFYLPATAAASSPGTIFIGTNRIWSNAAFGRDPNAWQPRSASPITSAANDFLTTIATVGDGSGPFWAGSAAGAVLFSTDGGATFSSRRSGLPSAIVSKILPVTADGRSAYVTFGGFSGGASAHVFRTSDAGQTWTNISGNLPDVPITTIVVDPTDANDVFVGSDVGVFRSVDGGVSWTSFNQGLPNVSVYDLKFHQATGDLWAATYGRGVFRIANASPAGAPVANFSFSPPSPQPGQAVTFTDTSTGSPTSWSWTFGDGATSASQSPTHAFAAAGTFSVTHTATNAAGSNSVTKSVTVGVPTGPCAAGANTLCLSNSRFKVQVTWRVPSQGTSGAGSAVALSGDTGYFWFFSSSNIELVIKVLDGRGFNSKFWVFYGALSDVEYTLTVTDTATGLVKTYFNPSGQLSSVADTAAFPGGSASATAGPASEVGGSFELVASSGPRLLEAASITPVGASASANLTPYRPSGWSDKIVVSRTTGSNTDSSSLSPADTLYVDWAVINSGGAATAARFHTELYVDGALRKSWYGDPPLNSDYYAYVEDSSVGSLSAGTHTIRIKADSTNAIAESDESDNEYTKTIAVGGACAADSRTLCLNGSRFRVQVNWRVPSQGTSGAGTAVGLTGDTGYFWFFGSTNIELVVKVIDGRGFNNKFWVFYGALSDVEYTITVTDTSTGASKTYFNPSGTLASVADVAAF